MCVSARTRSASNPSSYIVPLYCILWTQAHHGWLWCAWHENKISRKIKARALINVFLVKARACFTKKKPFKFIISHRIATIYIITIILHIVCIRRAKGVSWNNLIKRNNKCAFNIFFTTLIMPVCSSIFISIDDSLFLLLFSFIC